MLSKCFKGEASLNQFFSFAAFLMLDGIAKSFKRTAFLILINNVAISDLTPSTHKIIAHNFLKYVFLCVGER